MDSIGNAEHALTFSDLRIHYYTGQSYLISGEGRNKVFGYRHGVMTDIGDLTEDERARLAKRLIEQAGEQELYQQLLVWEKEHSHWKRKELAFELDVLSLHIARLPDNREKNYLRVQELSMDLLSIDMYESEVHYYLIKAMFMSGSKTLSQIYFRQAEPYLTDEHMQELKTLFTSCRT